MKFYRVPKILIVFQICFCTLIFFSLQIAYGAENKSFLWEIKSKHNSVYLLGSMHLLPKTSYPLPALIEKTYQDCDTIVFEAQKEQDTFLQKTVKDFQEKGLASKGKSIKSYLSNETFKTLLYYLLDSDLKLSQFIHMKPWMCSALLFQIQAKKKGHENKLGIDNYFESKAKIDQKNIKGFETLKQTYNSYLYHDKVDQDIFMQLSLKELKSKWLNKMSTAWRNGDINFFLAMYDDSLLKKFPELDKRLGYDRNKLWVPKIIELTKKSENALVIVGLGHLIGEDSVIEMLSKKGFKAVQK